MSRRTASIERARQAGIPAEGLYVVGIENGGICGFLVDPRHRALSWVKVWELEALVTQLSTSTVMLAVVRDGPARPPTAHELAVFGDLTGRARRAGIVISGCLLVRGGQSFWLARPGRTARDD